MLIIWSTCHTFFDRYSLGCLFSSSFLLRHQIISCNRLKFGYDSKRILIRDCTLNVDMDSRVGVLGKSLGVYPHILIYLA